MFKQAYATVFEGDARWRGIQIPQAATYAWDEGSSYVKHPPYFVDMPAKPAATSELGGMRVLAVLGDSITTDHISPLARIKPDSPAGRYLVGLVSSPRTSIPTAPVAATTRSSCAGLSPTFVSRTCWRAGPRAASRATCRPRSHAHLRCGMKYQADQVPLLVLAGRDYGCGSSRDWAAKGTRLLGVRAVLAESFERIHRSNLVGMGVVAAGVLARRQRAQPGPRRRGDL